MERVIIDASKQTAYRGLTGRVTKELRGGLRLVRFDAIAISAEFHWTELDPLEESELPKAA